MCPLTPRWPLLAANLTATGTPYTYPGYDPKKIINDFAVVVLDTPITSLAPAKIAPLNYLNKFSQKVLTKTNFESVGYGISMHRPEASGPQKPVAHTFPLIRRYAVTEGVKLDAKELMIDGNASNDDLDTTGAVCFGDSGGPTFHNGYLVGVNSEVDSVLCRWHSTVERVDTATALQWLSSFGVVTR